MLVPMSNSQQVPLVAGKPASVRICLSPVSRNTAPQDKVAGASNQFALVQLKVPSDAHEAVQSFVVMHPSLVMAKTPSASAASNLVKGIQAWSKSVRN
jgi:hypothetical protein